MAPPEIARVRFSTQANLPGGFGVFAGVFLVVVVVAVVALPLLLLVPKTPGKTPKPPGKLACVENLTRAISGGAI